MENQNHQADLNTNKATAKRNKLSIGKKVGMMGVVALTLVGCAKPSTSANSLATGNTTAATAEQPTDAHKQAEILADRLACEVASVTDTREQPKPELGIPNSADLTTVKIQLNLSTKEQAQQLLAANGGTVPGQTLRATSVAAHNVSLTDPEEYGEALTVYGDAVLEPDAPDGSAEITLYPPREIYRPGNQVLQIDLRSGVITGANTADAVATEATIPCVALEYNPASGYQIAQEDYELPPVAITTHTQQAG